MKAVILAGGLGARLSEETSLKPKPHLGRTILRLCGHGGNRGGLPEQHLARA